MTEISMREQAANIGITDLSGGFLNAVLNPFWLSSSGNLSLFPFRNADGISFRLMAQTWKWPSGWTITINPNDSDNANYANAFQGIACDGNAWFITNGGPKSGAPDVVPRLWRRGVGVDLDALVGLAVSGIHFVENPSSMSDSYVHFGDCCVIYDGSVSYVAVAVEYSDKDNHLLVWKIHQPASSSDPYMTFFDAAPLTHEGEAPWFAVMPGTSLGFSSPFFNTTPPNVGLRIYDVEVTTLEVLLGLNGALFPLYFSDGSPFDVGRIQGGAVSGAGHLYLVCDKLSVDGGGLYGFDLISGRKMEFVSLGDGGGGGLNDYELEGMCVFDTSGVPGASGQIHVGKIQLQWTDNLFIYHLKALSGQEELV